ncbi:MAG: glucosamine-6-phosphate isomerase [Chloroflexota bacterium]
MSLLAPGYLTISAAELAAQAGERLLILPTRAAVYQDFARSIADEIQQNNTAGRRTVLILPVGPLGGFPPLAAVCNGEGISWRQVHTFNMDEYLDWQARPIPLEHPLSFHAFMQRFFAQLDPALRPPPEQCHFPDPARPDATWELMQALGGVDSCYGGIGVHGHIAFNEPPRSRWRALSVDEFRRSRTRVISLAPETMVMNSIRGLGGAFAVLPPMGITLGMAECLAARRLRLYCDGGEWQRTAVRTALLGPVDVAYPATLTQDHPNCVIVCTAATAEPAVRPEQTLWDAALAAANAAD